ncbi:hypothetical protein NGB36_03700 [Streptomyces sp. RB6PN25]|uniref:DUF3006 domain-containing protein n=1 Tax=Streptomyces humicola TaxID=2953240 RepID=A0ABT1PPX4_9ACTN|nr:hypothetical protein [Streptomyces humicola]MCQ4079721.1 hypothetical protein [Streptomyces humicola]
MVMVAEAETSEVAAVADGEEEEPLVLVEVPHHQDRVNLEEVFDLELGAAGGLRVPVDVQEGLYRVVLGRPDDRRRAAAAVEQLRLEPIGDDEAAHA